MIIQELKPSRRVRDRWLAVLEDGSILRVGKNQIADFALYTGRELSDQEADRLLQAVENENFRSYALRVVTDTPKSRKMLLKILAEKSCPPEKAEEIADWLEDLGYLPRVAFNLDRYFKKCSACGKQSLTMCMVLPILHYKHNALPLHQWAY